jgi:excisionase family DNA binding protein
MLADVYATKAEAARLLGVNRLTIYRWVKSGKLKAERIGREVLIRRSDLSRISKRKRAND